MGDDYENLQKVNSQGVSRIRDVWTARIVGCVGGALIPLLLILIPVVNKYIDSNKEIAVLELQTDMKSLKEKIAELEKELDKCRGFMYRDPLQITPKNPNAFLRGSSDSNAKA